MNRKSAQKLAQSETLTIGDLRHMIFAARVNQPICPWNPRMSKVNPAIPHDRALDIYLAAIAGRPDDETPKAWRPDPYSRHAGAMKPSCDYFSVVNILRDCGVAA
jgi:hypothetical protein